MSSDASIKRHSEQIQNPFYLEETITEQHEETSPRTEPSKKRASSNPALPDKRSSVKLPAETSPRKVDFSVTVMTPPKDTKEQITATSNAHPDEEFDKVGSKEKLIEEESPKKKEKKKSFRRSKKEGNNE